MLFVLNPELIGITYEVQSFILQTKYIGMLMHNSDMFSSSVLHVLPRQFHPYPYPFCVDEFQVEAYSLLALAYLSPVIENTDMMNIYIFNLQMFDNVF